jgi:hypothetical protein
LLHITILQRWSSKQAFAVQTVEFTGSVRTNGASSGTGLHAQVPVFALSLVWLSFVTTSFTFAFATFLVAAAIHVLSLPLVATPFAGIMLSAFSDDRPILRACGAAWGWLAT